MSGFLTYAHDNSKKLVYIEDVEGGNKCNCFCPNCGAPLDAKNRGEIRDHHFAHSKGHSECKGAYETMLHLLAKEIIEEAGCIMLPNSGNNGFPSGSVQLRSVEVEKWDEENSIRPDIQGIMSNGERLLIEIRVSHKVDPKKRKTIIESGIKCIEIDVRWFGVNKQTLKSFLLHSPEKRSWIQPNKDYVKKEGTSFSNGRNPLHKQAIEFLKKKFQEEDLCISWGGDRHSLKCYGYDVCESFKDFRGYKSDLLLYRSNKEDKGYISIGIRGRSRGEKNNYPLDIRLIDIIIRDGLGLERLKNNSVLMGTYLGNWKRN